jgi:hypothetical protein
MFPIAQSPSTGIVASCKGEDFASPDNIEAFAESCRQILTIYKTMPPESAKGVLDLSGVGRRQRPEWGTRNCESDINIAGPSLGRFLQTLAPTKRACRGFSLH